MFACVCENLCACVKETKKGKLRKSDHSAAKSYGMTITGYFRKSFTSVLTGDPGVCVCVDMHVYDREMEKEQKGVQAQEIFELQNIPSFICTQSMTFKTLLESQEAGKIRKWLTIHG